MTQAVSNDWSPGMMSPRRYLRAGPIGLVILLLIAVPCFALLPWSMHYFNAQQLETSREFMAPSSGDWLGTDNLGRSMLWRCLLGGAISLGIGIAAACISVGIGVAWGATAGYLGGRVDSLMMRVVDVLYGLPYILLVVMVDLALRPVMQAAFTAATSAEAASGIADVLTLLLAIGGVSWLTMARVIRGQVLSLRKQPFIEAARACGFGTPRILWRHILPNLTGPIIVYATLTVPMAILQESFLSFLGIGVQPPLPSWGSLAASGMDEVRKLGLGFGTVRWWLPLWPCLLLGLTLMALNFLGDDLRRRFDPRSSSV